jgi:hypothetical protein
MEELVKDKTKVRIAFAQAVIQTLWMKGLITKAEYDKMNKNCRSSLEGKC